MEEKGEIKHIVLEGTPYRRGFQHGSTLKEEIREVREVIKEYLSRVRRVVGGGILLFFMESISLWYRRYIPDEYLEEIRGVADGAGVSRRFVLLVNVFDDLTSLLACSAFCVVGNNNTTLLGRNLDYPVFTEPMCRLTTLFVHRPHKGLMFLTVGWPGYIGALSAMNSTGLSLASLAVPAHDKSMKGIPTGILYRECIQYSETMDELIERLTSARRTIGNNVIVASPEEMCVVEVSARRYSVRTTRERFITVTNHYKTREMRSVQRPYFRIPPALDIPEDFFSVRYSELRDSLLEKGCMEMTTMDVDGAIGVLRTPEVSNPGTVQSMVFVPGRLEVWLAKGLKPPASQADFERFRLHHD